MSNDACELMAEELENVDAMDFDALSEELQTHLGLAKSSADTYIYKFAQTKKRNGEKLVLGLTAEGYEKAGRNDKQMRQTEDGDMEVVDAGEGASQPIGEPTGEFYGSLEVLEDVGHSGVKSLGHGYFKRQMASGSTDIDVITKAMASDNFAVLLEGYPGTGKDTAYMHISERTNRPMERVNLGNDVTADDLLGRFQPTSDKHFEFVPGPLLECVQQGKIFNAAELNAANPEVLLALNSLLESKENRELFVQQLGKVVKPHPEFQLVASQNPSTFAGTQPLNAAFKDRFFVLPIDYVEQRAEKQVLLEQTDALSESDAEKLTDIAARLRGRLKDGDIYTIVTTRTLIKIGEMAEIMDVDEAAAMIFEGTAEESDKNVITKVLGQFFDTSGSDDLGELFG